LSIKNANESFKQMVGEHHQTDKLKPNYDARELKKELFETIEQYGAYVNNLSELPDHKDMQRLSKILADTQQRIEKQTQIPLTNSSETNKTQNKQRYCIILSTQFQYFRNMRKIEKTGKSKKLTVYSLITLVTIVLLQSCGSVPVTGRKQLLLVSDDEVISLSLKQYQEFMSTAKVIKGTKDAEMVARVGQRLASAVESYLSNNGYATEIQKYKWEFSLVQDQSVNAFAMPGGKVVVNSGLIPVAGDEASLAVVVGHEIAHVVAKHANERLSQQISPPIRRSYCRKYFGWCGGIPIGTDSFRTWSSGRCYASLCP